MSKEYTDYMVTAKVTVTLTVKTGVVHHTPEEAASVAEGLFNEMTDHIFLTSEHWGVEKESIILDKVEITDVKKDDEWNPASTDSVH